MTPTPASPLDMSTIDVPTLQAWLSHARSQALLSLRTGGIPIGAILVHLPSGQIISQGHNQRVQRDSNVLHAEMDCFENVGRTFGPQGGNVPWKECVCVATLSPCLMCTGAILMYGIPIVIIGENANYLSPGEQLLDAQGVSRIVLNDEACVAMMGQWIAEHGDVWNEDVAGRPNGARAREVV